MTEPILILLTRLLNKCPIQTKAQEEYDGLKVLFGLHDKQSMNIILYKDGSNVYNTQSGYISVRDIKETKYGILVHGEKGGMMAADLNGKSFSNVILYFKNKKEFEAALAKEDVEKIKDIEQSVLLVFWHAIPSHILDAGPAKEKFLEEFR